MPGMFCRHNRLTSKCPICSRELEQTCAARRPCATSPCASPGARRRPPRSARRRARDLAALAKRLVTRQLARAADDGYRNPLVPGLKATADAERLAVALTQAARRGCEPPGPYPLIADEPDLEQATWLAFLLALAPELRDVLAEAQPALGGRGRRRAARGQGQAPPPPTAPGSERAGSQEAAFTGEASWTPERRFGRVFERLALPGFSRAARFDLLAALGAAGRYALEADALHFVEDDATTLAAKRLLVSGDRMLLERRARDLADAAELPIGRARPRPRGLGHARPSTST